MNYQFSFFSVKFSGNNVEENREIIESRKFNNKNDYLIIKKIKSGRGEKFLSKKAKKI